MTEIRDYLVFLMLIFGAGAVFLGAAGAGLNGTQSLNLCKIPIVSGFSNQCSTDVAERYDLKTEVNVAATEQTALISEQSFDYSTDKSGIGNLAFIGPQQDLAFGGADKVVLNFNLLRNDKVIADGNKFVGEIGILQQEKVSFNVNNLEKGRYTVQYELKYDPGFGGASQTETLEKQVRIPKVVE